MDESICSEQSAGFECWSVDCCNRLRVSASDRVSNLQSRKKYLATFAAAFVVLLILGSSVTAQSPEWPDIRSVQADLKVPEFVQLPPAAGLRVRRTLNGYDAETVYHSLYLPVDWSSDKSLPVIVEYAGNGGYRDALGDECSGRPEGCSLGYGLSGGEGFLWLSLPYLNNAGTDLAMTWWGNAPDYDPLPTLKYCHAALEDAFSSFGGDRDRVVLCGFSRGAIACNYLGLYNDEVSKYWRAFVPCSHYDGVRKWPFPGSDAESAAARLARLGDRPQYIIGERNQTEETRSYLLPTGQKHLVFASTGFRNHSDQWILRPSPAREHLRAWLRGIVNDSRQE